MLEQLKTRLRHMEGDEVDIEAYDQHKGKAFGLMDAKTAQKYDDIINNVQVNSSSSRIHHLDENQSAIIKETIQVTNRTFNKIYNHLNQLFVSNIYNHLLVNDQSTSYAYAQTTKKLNGLITKTMSILHFMADEHNRLSSQIIKCKISQLVPDEILSQDLNHLESILREDQRLPIDLKMENVLHIFKFTTIKSSIFNGNLIVEIKIPIVQRASRFSVYRIIRVPVNVKDYSVIVRSSIQHALVDYRKREFLPITAAEYTDSIFNMAGEKIIQPATTSQYHVASCEKNVLTNPSTDSIPSQLCEYDMIPSGNYFVPINHNDIFYVSISKPLKIIENCYGKAQEQHILYRSGLLRLRENCRISTDQIHLRTKNNHRLDMGEIKLSNAIAPLDTIDEIMEKIATLNNTKIPKLKKTTFINDHINDFDKLASKFDEQIEKNKLDISFKQMNYYDYYRSLGSIIFSASIFFVVGILLILYLEKMFFSPTFWLNLMEN